MTVEYVRAKVAEIAREAHSGDDEVAHSIEDELYAEVISAIANINNHDNAIALCREALATKELSFPRHCS